MPARNFPRTAPLAATALALLLALGGGAAAQDDGSDPPMPDLRVVDIELTHADPAPGDEVAFVATLRNVGDAAAGGFDVAFVVDGTAIGARTAVGLAAGATVEVTSAAWTATEGEHTILARADAGDEVAERLETNNQRTEGFEVGAPPLPDLRVADVSWSPAAPDAGDRVTFRAHLRNAGDAGAGPFRVAFFAGARALGEVAVDGLGAGDARNVTSAAWTAVAGAHRVRAVVDSDEDIAEASERNNVRAESLVVAADAPAPGDHDGNGAGDRVVLCHIPPGNPGKAHTLRVGAPAVGAHLAHGDHEGACTGDEGADAEARAGSARGRAADGNDGAREPRSRGHGLAKPDKAGNPRAERDAAGGLAAQSSAAFQAAGSGAPLLALAGLGGAGVGMALWVRRGR